MFKKACLCVMVVIFPLLPIILNAQVPDTLWTRRYNGPANGFDCAQACAVDDSGNIYVTGYSSNGSDYDCLTIKYNAVGETLWTRRYNGPANEDDGAFACDIDGLGNLYVAGRTSDGIFTDCLIIKYNSAGDTLWISRYSGPAGYSDYIYGCAVDGLGNLYVTGHSDVGGGGGFDCLTIKYSANGDTLWTRLYNGPTNSSDVAYACAVDSSGNLYVTGYIDNGAVDYLTIKYNTTGDTLCTRRYNGPDNGYDEALGCAVDGSGNLYVTGWSYNSLNDDYLTIKYNSTGDTIWTRRYNDPDNFYDGAAVCTVDSLGGLYVTGWAFNGTSDDCLTIKYNSDGDSLWTHWYNGPANSADNAHGCVVDGMGNLYVTGFSDNGTNWDYLTIKYNTATGVAGKPELPMTVSKLRLEQNRPNPFNQHTTISYQLPASGTTSLKIYNAAGQLVKTFDMGQQPAGCHQVEWRDSKITAGVYFYRLTAGNYQATKKLVVLK